MNTARLKQARRLFQNPMVEPRVVRHNIRQWARSVRFLGAQWRAHPAQYVQKESVQ